MIYNTSYFDPEIKEKIDQSVGKAFSLIQRIKLGGIGSARMMIDETSPNLQKLLPKVEIINYASVELRPTGIIIHFKNNTVHYSWVIPYYKLHLYQSKTLSIHADGSFFKFKKEFLKANHLKFFTKIQALKSNALHPIAP